MNYNVIFMLKGMDLKCDNCNAGNLVYFIMPLPKIEKSQKDIIFFKNLVKFNY